MSKPKDTRKWFKGYTYSDSFTYVGKFEVLKDFLSALNKQYGIGSLNTDSRLVSEIPAHDAKFAITNGFKVREVK